MQNRREMAAVEALADEGPRVSLSFDATFPAQSRQTLMDGTTVNRNDASPMFGLRAAVPSKKSADHMR